MAVNGLGTIIQNAALIIGQGDMGTLSGVGAYFSLAAAPTSGSGKYVIGLPTFDSASATSNTVAIFFFGVPGGGGTHHRDVPDLGHQGHIGHQPVHRLPVGGNRHRDRRADEQHESFPFRQQSGGLDRHHQ